MQREYSFYGCGSYTQRKEEELVPKELKKTWAKIDQGIKKGELRSQRKILINKGTKTSTLKPLRRFLLGWMKWLTLGKNNSLNL